MAQEEVPAPEQSIRCLTPEELQEVTRTSKQLERHFGSPHNVEWAFAGKGNGSQLYILQTRPQTAIPPWPPEPELEPERNPVDYVLRSLQK